MASMPYPSWSVEPLTPAWLQALIPLLKSALEETAGRDSTIEVVITIDADRPAIANWKEVATRRAGVNLVTRQLEKRTELLFESEPAETSLRRAIDYMSREGKQVLESIKLDPTGSRQMILNIKEGRLAGIKSLRSVPVRNRRR